MGPVRSGKTSELARKLNVLRDSGYWRNGEVLVVKHPMDDPNKPDKVGEHKAKSLESPDNIAELITPETKVLAVAGLAHISEPDVIALADAVVRSRRILIGSALNLAANGQTYNQMQGLCALVDSVTLTKAVCGHLRCSSREANRSVFAGNGYEPRCSHHARFEGSPPISEGAGGTLELDVSTMYAGKSEAIARRVTMNRVAGILNLTFKPRADNRDGIKDPQLFSEGCIVPHSKKKIPAINVDHASNIKSYLADHRNVRDIIIDEGQFMPGLYDLALELIPLGYRFLITGLLRGFNRGQFGEISKLMCLADKIEIPRALCSYPECYDLATENQRMKKEGGVVKPASFNDPLEAIGGKDSKDVSYFYEARCRNHWGLTDEPPLKYELPKLKK